MINRFSRAARIAVLRSGAALGALTAMSAHAQEAPASSVALAQADTTGADATGTDATRSDIGSDIVVTARRREEKVQDVPIAISVITAATLEKTGNYTLNQLTQQVPSLQVITTNPRNSVINIRGLGGNSSVAVDGLEYGVGFYVDGVYYGRPGQSQFDLIDIARIEVLRGPQGTLFGKNTTAGAINITTQEPSFTPQLTVEGQIGDFEYHQIRGSASLPIIADKVAVRLSVSDTHRDGYLINAYDGSRAQDYDNFNVRGQVLIKPTDDIRIRIIGDYSNQHQHFALPIIAGYFRTFANGAVIPNNIFDRAARTGYTLPDPNAFRRIGNADAPFQANMKSYGASGEVNWDLGRATITSITAYRWWDWYPANDVDGTSLSINVKGQQINFQRQFSQELRIASNGTHKIDYVAGLFYFWQVVRGYGANEYGKDFAAWNLPGATPAAIVANTNLALTNFEADSYSDPRTKSYAAFGQVDWHIVDGLTLTGGLRFTHEDKTGSFTRFQLPNTGVDLSGLAPTQLAQVLAIRNNPAYQLTNLSFDAKTRNNALSGLATLSYKVTPEVLVYGTYSRGSKSGGLNITAGGVSRPVVDPEKVNAFEVGVKSQLLDRKLTLNADAFLTEIKDYQGNVSVQIPGSTATLQYIDSIPKVRSKGIEVDASYSPFAWLSLSASGAYTDARYVRYTNAPQRPELAIPGTLQVQDLSGVRLPNVSKFAYSLALDASQPVAARTEVYTRVDWLHRSSFNSTATNSIYGVIPAYGLLNVKVGVRLLDGQVDLSVWARNLLQQDYFVAVGPGTFGLITGTLGDPRTIGGTLRVKW